MSIPDTAFWYHTAYSVATVVYLGYIVSLWRRRRSVERQQKPRGAGDDNS
jgi:hypothetical protein